MNGKELIVQIGKMVLPPGKRSPDDEGFNLKSDSMTNIYKNVYLYMVNSKAAMKQKIIPEKGLLFCGAVGTGKTVCVRVMQQMALRVNGLEKREMCIVGVNDFLKVYKDNDKETGGETKAFEMYGYDKKMEMCIDELGWEAVQKNYYGNDISAIIANWIMDRHRLFVETGIRTHFTTNLKIDSPEETIDLERLYGPRITDRLKEMCNVINWVGGSWR